MNLYFGINCVLAGMSLAIFLRNQTFVSGTCLAVNVLCVIGTYN